MDSTRKHGDTTIAIIVIIAGLATGGIITWHFLSPKAEPVYEPPYRVVNSMAEAEALAQTETGAQPPASEATAPGAVPEGASASAPADAPADAPATEGESSEADRAVIRGARRQLDETGVAETVELTEELYIRLSAQVVLMAHALKDDPRAADPEEAQHLIADYTSKLLAENHVDGQEYFDFTRWVASDHDRAERIGELILREAEKHTRIRINVSDVPGVAPAPVAPPDD